ncbi:uncharacterized protein [Diabrotica undecimpunctata]|uniref:uncharacterized protein n=1 Tax=Diabrotica undecimpunctata TaxID=50387 RepID=UPI003B63AC3B
MSKIKRKITVNLSTKGKSGVLKTRPSVFERLGTKATTTGKEYCHPWAQSGSCPYGKGCKYSSTHTLISPSKQRAAKTQRRHVKDGHKRSQHEEWDQWDPDELEDADPDDLERKRQELQRELELQMKMESKAKKKEKKKESSPSTDTTSTTTDSSTSSDDSSSTSSSSAEARRRKLKKIKAKRSSSTSSEERGRSKHKSKIKRTSKSTIRDKSKKGSKIVKTKSVSPTRQRKKSETPPIKTKAISSSKKLSSEKSPRPLSRTSIKEKHRTPSPKPSKDKEREKEREREREREKEKDKEREREREKEKEREREREKERERAKERAKEREREKEKEHKKKEIIRSPKRDNRSIKDIRKRDTPDSAHPKDRKLSPGRSKGGGRRDHKSPMKDERRTDRRDDRGRGKDIRSTDRGPTRKETTKRDSRDRERERERDRERRLAREREETREKEREEALARCQERQRERERLKKEEEQRRRERTRREDRGLDKPSADRVERLLPPIEERVPPSRKGHSTERDRDRGRDVRGRDRSTDRSRKSPDRRGDMDKDRSYDRGYDNRRPDHERDYITGHRDKDYDSPYERGRPLDDRRYLDVDEHYGEGARDDRIYGGSVDDRRSRRDMWDERGVDDRENVDHRSRYAPRDDHNLKNNRGGDWGDLQHGDYSNHDWDRNRRPLNPEWDGRENWDIDQNKQAGVGQGEDEWRHYNRPVDSWNSDDRRRWPQEWRERSRPRSATSHQVEPMNVPPSEDSNLESNRKKEIPPLLQPVPAAEETTVKPEPSEEETLKQSSPPPVKRAADEAVNSPDSAKKICVKQETVQLPLEDDLSEISDDADDILNMDEDVPDSPIKEESTEAPEIQEATAASSVAAPEVNTSAMSQKSQSPPPEQQAAPKSPAAVAAPNNKGGSIDEDNMELDFEEISEDELEEESKMRGLVDALGVDWSSLVAESKPRTKPFSCAKIRWEAHNVLVNLGVSVQLAGETLVKDILKQYAAAKLEQQKEEVVVKTEISSIVIKKEPQELIMNGVEVKIKSEPTEETQMRQICEIKTEPMDTEEIQLPHPIAAIQVADREKLAIRKNLFTSVGSHRRALAARRDLTIRRHLCNLPITDKHVEAPKRHNPELFQLATQLFERSL